MPAPQFSTKVSSGWDDRRKRGEGKETKGESREGRKGWREGERSKGGRGWICHFLKVFWMIKKIFSKLRPQASNP